MVELKRLMAKLATDSGQIIEAGDLADSAIFDRLESDMHFRGLATRLLQRYGYLTPQLNPQSPVGQEQALLLKARAEQLARTAANPQLEPELPQGACLPGQENAGGCRETTSAPRPATQQIRTSGETPFPSQEELGSPASPKTESLPAGVQQTDLSGSSLIETAAVSSSRSARPNAPLGSGGSEEVVGAAAGMAPVLPESPEKRQLGVESTIRPEVAPSRERRPADLQPVEMVHSPNPYADVPSLYDLYVQAAPRTGRLERFGLEVFHHEPAVAGGTSVLPMDLPAGPDYVLGPGDGLTIDLWGGVSQRLFRTVDREGRLSLPEAGPLLVSGRTLGEVQEAVQRVLRTQYRDVSADVSLERLRTVRVYVVGDVDSPGAYDISSLSTPLNALYAAGGVTPRGSLRLLQHYRGKQLVEEVDAYDLLLHGIRGELKNLENGDTLLVPPVGAQVTVDGMVRRPAIYELRGETNLAQALELAGGILPAAALRHIEVQRLEAHEKRTMLSLDLGETTDPQAVRRELAAFAVRDGDAVHIFPIAPYNTAAVYVEGHVLRPGRYAFTPGMRLTDLLASYHDLLPEPAEHYAEIVRLRPPDSQPVVESFDLAAALANPGASPKLEPLDTVRIFGRYDFEPAPVVWLTGEVRAPGEYRTSGQMHLRDAIYLARGLMPDAARDAGQVFRPQPDGSLRILNVNLAAALEDDPLENILLQPRDRIVVHRSLYRVDPPSVYIKGEVENPGRYPLGANMQVADLLQAAGGPKRSADLKNADLTRYQTASGMPPTGEHKRVDLSAALAGDQNFPLRDGDVLTIPQLPGWNDLGAAVKVTGEVKNPGTYGIRPGERLSSVLKRAGGLLPTAYPQGAIFTRREVREFQEKSRQELIQRVEQESVQVKTSLTTPGSEQAALQLAAQQQRERVLDALRKAPISGRLVIHLWPGMKGFENSAQDIELRAGDILEIPKQPGFVLVVGQVYNSNAITFTPGKNAGWYLSRAGGATQLADRGAIFVVRASGEVTSRHQGGWWSGGVLSAVIHPGDAIVVPERPVLGESRWKSFLALAQIAQIGAVTAAVVP
jgi:protein involved in polysaccharide export with SLBB domain